MASESKASRRAPEREPPEHAAFADADRRALLGKGLSFNVELDLHREITVLFGPSGAGKSLTLGLLAGFEHPERGRIVLDDTVSPRHEKIMSKFLPENGE
jgi:molybdate transport system ATP-binding protein